jgi:hypothetical protein
MSANKERGKDRSQYRQPAEVQVPADGDHPAGHFAPSEVEVRVVSWSLRSER